MENDGKWWKIMDFEHKIIICCHKGNSNRFRLHSIYIPFLWIVQKSWKVWTVVQPIETHQAYVKMMEHDGILFEKWWKMMENDGKWWKYTHFQNVKAFCTFVCSLNQLDNLFKHCKENKSHDSVFICAFLCFR